MRIIDDPAGPARTPATLVASLRDRLTRLATLSGRETVGSLLAGYAVAGQQAAQTAEGRRLAQGLRASSAGVNGQTIWSALRIDRLAEATPSPVLDHLRNDLALLLADDLDNGLRDAQGLRAEPRRTAPEPSVPFDSVDYLVGMWLVSRELVAVIEAMAEDGVEDVNAPAATPPAGPLLR